VEPLRTQYFAEGCTRDGFSTWLCIGNPQSRAVNVTVNYYYGDNRGMARAYSVPARSRVTVDVNLAVGAGQDVSCRTSAPQPVIVERPVYFLYHGAWAGGHTGMGAPAAGTEWYFAEGCTR
jgi:hypothetical protein